MQIEVVDHGSDAQPVGNVAERSAPHAVFLLRSSSDTWLGNAANARGSALLTKQSNMGNAAASNWLIGGKPRMSSIVRSMLHVE